MDRRPPPAAHRRGPCPGAAAPDDHPVGTPAWPRPLDDGNYLGPEGVDSRRPLADDLELRSGWALRGSAGGHRTTTMRGTGWSSVPTDPDRPRRTPWVGGPE